MKDIPLLGTLFSSKSSANERKELIVLMRPTVLKTPDLASMQLAEEKNRLPGIRRAEAENLVEEQKLLSKEAARAAAQKQAEERKPLSAAERELFNRVTPVQPAEKKALESGEAPPL